MPEPIAREILIERGEYPKFVAVASACRACGSRRVNATYEQNPPVEITPDSVTCRAGCPNCQGWTSRVRLVFV